MEAWAIHVLKFVALVGALHFGPEAVMFHQEKFEKELEAFKCLGPGSSDDADAQIFACKRISFHEISFD